MNFLFICVLIKICTYLGGGYIPWSLHHRLCVCSWHNDKQFSKGLIQTLPKVHVSSSCWMFFPILSYCLLFFILVFLVGVLWCCIVDLDHLFICFGPFEYSFRQISVQVFCTFFIGLSTFFIDFSLLRIQFPCHTHVLQIYFPLSHFCIHFLNGLFDEEKFLIWRHF